MMKFTISNQDGRKLSVASQNLSGTPHVAILVESGAGTEVMALTPGEALLFTRMIEQARNDAISKIWGAIDEDDD